MHVDLSGKRVIVTGASRGIGLAIAKAFACEGSRVAICARGALGDAAADLRSLGAAEIIETSLDVRDTEAVRAFVASVVSRWGGVDVLVNNAGQGKGGTLETLNPEDFLDHANYLQVAHFRFTQAVTPHMRAQKWGRIININALNGHLNPPTGLTTVTNRAAGIALAKMLGQALAEDNILVNSLNMGFIDTGQWERHYKEAPSTITREEYFGAVLKAVPMRRFGRPEEVANIVLFLASELASFVSAASIDVSGGMQGQIAYVPTILRDLDDLGNARLKG